MKLKIFLFAIVAFLTISITKAQFRINNKGMVTVNATTSDWTTAFAVTVPTYNSLSYNLLYAGSSRFFVHASGYLWCERGGYFGSDSTLKENIKKLDSPLSKLKKINGFEYNYKDSYLITDRTSKSDSLPKEKRLGLVAQEVELVFPEVVKTMPDNTKAISYTDFIAVLIEAIKEQQVMIESLNNIVTTQELEKIEIKEQLNLIMLALKNAGINTNIADGVNKSNDAKLFQNSPNPFTYETEIAYYIPESAKIALLLIHDLNGSEIKSYKINTKGQGFTKLSGSEIKPGLYVYSLIVDNVIIETRKMILTEE